MTEFGRLNPDGSYEKVRTLPQSAMQKCPHFIMMHEHYRSDHTCRCNDPNHTEMSDWGYVWDGSQWTAPDDEEE